MSDIKPFHRQVLSQEKAFYEKMINEHPEKAEFFKAKLSRVEFDEWALDKKKGEKRVQFII